jgi:hypothetical protein
LADEGNYSDVVQKLLQLEIQIKHKTNRNYNYTRTDKLPTGKGCKTNEINVGNKALKRIKYRFIKIE